MPCPICGEAASWSLPHRGDPQIEVWRQQIGDRRAYEWRLCCRCGNAFPTVEPNRKVLQQIWQAARTTTCATTEEEAEIWRRRQRASRIVAERSYRLFSPLMGAPGRFIDIACGLGETVRVFADHGWEAEGIDADPAMQVLHRQLGITSHISQIEDLGLHANYDLIHIAHAIYFITHPMDLIGAARLAHTWPDGLFCVVISDFMSSVAVDLPSYAHTFIPTGASMRYALAIAGFKTVLHSADFWKHLPRGTPGAAPRA